MKYCFLGFLALLFISCKGNKQQLAALLKEWEQKEIIFPSHTVFTIQGKDTVDFCIKDQYKVLVYTDSTGCTGCRLRLADWKKFMQQVDSTSADSVQFLFFFFPKKGMELHHTLKMALFNNPVCIDKQDSLNILNHFLQRMDFQTFLLNENNKVVAVGNPIYNNKVRDLYLKILSNNKSLENNNEGRQTSLKIDQMVLDMQSFLWEEKQTKSLSIQNTGSIPLVINDVTTSCGCTVVDYPKQPILPDKSDTLHISYQAEHPGHFNKTISIYCNTTSSPILTKIKGNAEK